MMNRKDKHGLYGDMESTLATEDEADGGKEEKENPIIAALDKLNIKTHGRDSGVSRFMSSMSHAAADPAAGAAQEQGGDTAGAGAGWRCWACCGAACAGSRRRPSSAGTPTTTTGQTWSSGRYSSHSSRSRCIWCIVLVAWLIIIVKTTQAGNITVIILF